MRIYMLIAGVLELIARVITLHFNDNLPIFCNTYHCAKRNVSYIFYLFLYTYKCTMLSCALFIAIVPE